MAAAEVWALAGSDAYGWPTIRPLTRTIGLDEEFRRKYRREKRETCLKLRLGLIAQAWVELRTHEVSTISQALPFSRLQAAVVTVHCSQCANAEQQQNVQRVARDDSQTAKPYGQRDGPAGDQTTCLERSYSNMSGVVTRAFSPWNLD